MVSISVQNVKSIAQFLTPKCDGFLSKVMPIKGTNPPLKNSLNITEIYAKMFGRFH